MGVLLRK
nr:unnamed protein product [Callosobruchus chinensis]CAH7725269.1 unnamed protein product [Callosobruchus chinensis]